MSVTLLCLHRDGLPLEEKLHGYKVIRTKLNSQPFESDALMYRIGKLRTYSIPIFCMFWALYKSFLVIQRCISLTKSVIRLLRKLVGKVIRGIKLLLRGLWARSVSTVELPRYPTKGVSKENQASLASQFSIKQKIKFLFVNFLDNRFPEILAEFAFERRKQRYADFAKEALSFAREFRPEVVHAHDFNCLLAANLIHRELKIPYVYDSHELWTERNRSTTAISKAEKEWEIENEAKGIQQAAFSITVCESISEHLEKQYRIPKPLVIRNTPYARNVISDPSRILRTKLKFHDDDFVAVYLGILAKNRGITDILEALPLTDSRIKFVALGPMNPAFVDTFNELVDRLKISNRVFYHEPVPSEEVSTWISSCDLSLTTMNRACLSYVYTLPNKLFESVQARLPIIGPDSPEIIRIVNRYTCGITYKDGDSVDLANKITKLFEDRELLKKYKAGTEEAAKDLCWENEKKILIDAYSRFLDQSNLSETNLQKDKVAAA